MGTPQTKSSWSRRQAKLWPRPSHQPEKPRDIDSIGFERRSHGACCSVAIQATCRARAIPSTSLTREELSFSAFPLLDLAPLRQEATTHVHFDCEGVLRLGYGSTRELRELLSYSVSLCACGRQVKVIQAMHRAARCRVCKFRSGTRS